MRVVSPFESARDALFERLAAVFASAELDVGIRPKVTKGFPVSQPRAYVAVDEVCDTAATRGAVSCGHDEVEFTIHVWAFAEHADRAKACNAVLGYVWTIFCAVLADRMLERTVGFATPSVRDASTAANGSKRFIAAATIDVTCTIGSTCPAWMKEVIDGIEKAG